MDPADIKAGAHQDGAGMSKIAHFQTRLVTGCHTIQTNKTSNWKDVECQTVLERTDS